MRSNIMQASRLLLRRNTDALWRLARLCNKVIKIVQYWLNKQLEHQINGMQLWQDKMYVQNTKIDEEAQVLYLWTT